MTNRSGGTDIRAARRARLGVSLLFFTNGVLLAALLPRYPEIKRDLDLSNSAFGLVVTAFPIGALAAAAFAARVTRRLGTLPVAAVGSVLLSAAFLLVAAAPTTWVLVVALLAVGAIDAVVDAAQNIQGVMVEDRLGQSVINSFHALWSLGAAAGGVVGAWCAANGIDRTTQSWANGALWALVAVVGGLVARLPASAEASAAVSATADPVAAASSSRRHAWLLLVPIVVLAVCGTLVEDMANNWSVLFLRTETDAPLTIAGLGVSVMIGAQFVGRIVGDPMTDRWGRDRVALAGGLLIATGSIAVVLSPVYQVSLVGLMLAGFGSATLVPAAYAAAGRVPGLPEGTGIALLGWLMRIGFLVTSPVVGVVSDATSLRTAFLVPAAAGLVAAVLSERGRRISDRRTAGRRRRRGGR